MPNLSHPEVSQVVGGHKDQRTVIIKNKSDIKDEVRRTTSSGTTANLGDRIQLALEFANNDHRYLQDIYLRFKMRNKGTQSFNFLASMINFIDEIRLTLNGDKTMYIHQFGLSKYSFWDHYTNYGGDALAQFWAENINVLGSVANGINDNFGVVNRDVGDKSTLGSYQDVLLPGQSTDYFYMPMRVFTNIFVNMPVSHLWKLIIQIQLKNPTNNSLEELRTAGKVAGDTESLGDKVQFTDIECLAYFDRYKQCVMDPRGHLQIYDQHYERRTYPVAPAGQPITIRLNNDFSPFLNMNMLYMHTQSTQRDTDGANNSSDAGYLKHRSSTINRIEMLRNGVRVLDLESKAQIQEHILQYYKKKHRHKNWGIYQSPLELNDIPTSFFLDLSRATISHNNDKHQIVKEINALQTFSQKFGEFVVRVYLDGGNDPSDELVVVARASRIISIGSASEDYAVSEEI